MFLSLSFFVINVYAVEPVAGFSSDVQVGEIYETVVFNLVRGRK